MRYIWIGDNGCKIKYAITGDEFKMVEQETVGQCRVFDVLNDWDAELHEDDPDLVNKVMDAWLIGYRGDPREHGLSVIVGNKV